MWLQVSRRTGFNRRDGRRVALTPACRTQSLSSTTSAGSRAPRAAAPKRRLPSDGCHHIEAAMQTLTERPPHLLIAAERLGLFNGLHLVVRCRVDYPTWAAIVTPDAKIRCSKPKRRPTGPAASSRRKIRASCSRWCRGPSPRGRCDGRRKNYPPPNHGIAPSRVKR